MDDTAQQIAALTLVAVAVVFELWRRWRKQRKGEAGCDGCSSASNPKAKPDEAPISFYRRR